MSLHHGAKIITKGLVFAYDMGPNPGANKSWKGKPAVNTWYNDSYNFTSAATFSIVTDYPSTQSLPIEARGKKVIKLIADTAGTLGQCIPWRSGVDQVNGGTYNHSVWCYLESGSVVTVGQHWNPWDYGSSQYPPLRKWVRLNDPVTNSANNYGNIGNAYRTDGVAYFTAPQYELGTDMSPFVHGTRSNTQSLLDWTGNYTLTASSGVIYNDDGTFSFTSTANTSHYTVNSQNIISGTDPFTIEAWTNKTSGNYGAIFGNYGSGYTSGMWFATAGLYIGGSVYHSNSATTMAGVHHSAATRDANGNVKLYRDGVLVTSGTLTSSIPSNINFRIVNDVNSGGEALAGNIYTVNVYNRVLTAEEVNSNFNALRGRYGI